MTDQATALTPTRDHDLVFDQLDEKLERFKALRKVDSVEADKVLDELGATTEVDRLIITELSGRRALGHPEKFNQAHALAMQAMEVLDRNGGKGVKVKKLGPLNPVVGFFAQMIARYIVRSYAASAIGSVKNLYTRREARCVPGDPERLMLLKARRDAERCVPAYKKNPIGLPSFVLGGAAITSLTSVLRNAGSFAGRTRVYTIIAGVLIFAVFLVLAWAVLRGAAVARRRIELTTKEPLKALWETVGRAGNPPRDPSIPFVITSLVVLSVAWLAIPIALIISFMVG